MATYKYKVRSGDTPTTLASRFQTTPQAILKSNPGVNQFSTGLTIRIPAYRPPQIPGLVGPPRAGLLPAPPRAGVIQYPAPIGPPQLQYQAPAGPFLPPSSLGQRKTFEYFQQHQGTQRTSTTTITPSAQLAAYVRASLRPDIITPEQASVLGWDAAEMQRRGYIQQMSGAWTPSPNATEGGTLPDGTTLPEGVTVGRFGRQVTASGDSYATSAANSFRIGRGADKWVMNSKAAASFRRRKMRGGASASVTQNAPAMMNDTRLVNWRISSG